MRENWEKERRKRVTKNRPQEETTKWQITQNCNNYVIMEKCGVFEQSIKSLGFLLVYFKFLSIR